MTDKHIARRLLAKQDKAAFNLIGGVTTNIVGTAPEPLTGAKLERLYSDFRAKFGPTPVWLSSRLFPTDKALQVEGATEKFMCAHPDFWERVKAECPKDRASDPTGNPRISFDGIPILNVDIEDGMLDSQREYIRAVWTRLKEAVEVAMIELPD